MDLIIFERKAFEEFATKIEQFILRVSNSPVVKGGKKKTNNWLDHQDVCQRLKISKRTLQTLRDNGTLAYTKIGNRTYYLPEDVDSIITKVEDRRKEAKWRGREIKPIKTCPGLQLEAGPYRLADSLQHPSNPGD